MAKVSWRAIVEISRGTGLNPYVIYGTLKGIREEGKSPDEAFFDATENENMYGTRPDIVADRRRHAHFLRDRYNVLISSDVVESGVNRKIPNFMKL